MQGAFCTTPSAKVIVQTARAIRSGVHQELPSRANRPGGPPSPTVSPATVGSASEGAGRARCSWVRREVTVDIVSYRAPPGWIGLLAGFQAPARVLRKRPDQ